MNWSSFLPPWNLARLFSFTRQTESERDYWRDEATRWQNYALMSRGMPAVSVATEPRISRPGPPPRPTINGLRRRAHKEWSGQALDALNGEPSMVEAADEYAANLKGASNG